MFQLGEMTNRAKSRLNAFYGKNGSMAKGLDKKVYHTEFGSKEVFIDRSLSMSKEAALWSSKRVVDGMGITAEVTMFMAAHYNDELSLEENFTENLTMVLGIRGSQMPLKLLKNNRNNPKNANDFQIADHQIRQFNTSQGTNFKSSREVYDYINKELNGLKQIPKDGKIDEVKVAKAEQIIRSTETDVFHKYLDANNYKIDANVTDAVPMRVELVPESQRDFFYGEHGKKSEINPETGKVDALTTSPLEIKAGENYVVKYYNSRGQLLYTEKPSNVGINIKSKDALSQFENHAFSVHEGSARVINNYLTDKGGKDIKDLHDITVKLIDSNRESKDETKKTLAAVNTMKDIIIKLFKKGEK